MQPGKDRFMKQETLKEKLLLRTLVTGLILTAIVIKLSVKLRSVFHGAIKVHTPD